MSFRMTLVLVQYSFLEIYKENPFCSRRYYFACIFVPLQKGRYEDNHFLTDVTRV